MRRLPPFFVIGSIGMIVTAIAHAVLSPFVGLLQAHTTFLATYPVFLAFLSIGTLQLLRLSAMQEHL
jgi:hypothetical protein